MANPFSPKGEHKALYRATMMGQNVLMHGPGGCGKSFVLRLLAQKMKQSRKNVYCTATTGIAALNLSEGTDLRTRTLHSWAGIGLGKDSKEKLLGKVHSNKKNRERWQSTDILIIDEVSMLGKSLFEKLDYIGRKIRKCEILPFGGIQLIFSGDFLQLPPIKDDFPFESPVWNRCNFYVIPFLTPRRYNDLEYFEMLLRFRRGEHTQSDMRKINSCVKKYDQFKKVQSQPPKKKIKLEDEPSVKPTILHSKNIDVDKVNSDELEKIEAESEIYFAKDHYLPVSTEGSSRGGSERFYENMLEETMSTCIQLKPGAQVMLKTNLDLEGGLVNGSRGVVLQCHDDSVDVKFNNDRRVKIMPHTWEFQDECMIASRTQIPLVLAYSTSIHKCISGDTLVTTTDGLKYIRDISNENLSPKGWSDVKDITVSTRVGWESVSKLYNGDVEKSIIIKTKLGYSLEGSIRHPILTCSPSGEEIWKKLPEISVGDVVMMRMGCVNVINAPLNTKFSTVSPPIEYIESDLAWVIGILVGDGSYRDKRDGTVDLTNNDELLLDSFTDICKRDLKVRVCKYKNRRYFCRKNIRTFLLDCGMSYSTAPSKSVPWVILQSPINVQASFLKGLFDADGGVSKTCIHFTSSSAILAKEVHILLLNMNIVSRLYYMPNDCKGAWRTEITGRNSRLYMDIIGFKSSAKNENYRKINLAFSKEEQFPRSNIGRIPNSKQICKDIQKKYMLTTKNGGSQFITRCIKERSRLNVYHIPYLKSIIDLESTDVGRDLLKKEKLGYFYDTIINKEEGECKMYDFEVPGSNSFITNGIISHNCQGMSLDNVICNLGQSIFLDGQAYVALSRVRNLDGLYLSNFYSRSIKANQKALDFENSIMKRFKKDEIAEEIVEDEINEDVKNVKNTESGINVKDNNDDDSKLCVICIENPKDVVIIPCGHLCACTKCIEGVKLCPVCRGEISSTNKVFM